MGSLGFPPERMGFKHAGSRRNTSRGDKCVDLPEFLLQFEIKSELRNASLIWRSFRIARHSAVRHEEEFVSKISFRIFAFGIVKLNSEFIRPPKFSTFNSLDGYAIEIIRTIAIMVQNSCDN